MKNVEKKKLMSRIFSMMLAGGVIASSFACTWAADTHSSESADVSVALTKNYMMPTGVTQPAADFGFAYTKDGVVTGASKVDSNVVADSTQPSLAALDKASNKDMSYTNSATKTGTVSGKDVYVKTISNILPAASAFSHAGEYVYTISETANINSSIDASMTYSQAQYKMHVFVKNKTGGGLLVAGAAVYQTKNDAGETGTNKKVDLDDSTLLKGKGGNDFQFTNTYSPSSERLEISKTVTGDYADLTKEFSMNITLTNPTKKSYFDKHGWGSIYYNGKENSIRFYAFIDSANGYDKNIYSYAISNTVDKINYLRYLAEHAKYYRDIGVSPDDRIVLLSTCSHTMTNGRYILVGAFRDKKSASNEKSNGNIDISRWRIRVIRILWVLVILLAAILFDIIKKKIRK